MNPISFPPDCHFLGNLPIFDGTDPRVKATSNMVLETSYNTQRSAIRLLERVPVLCVRIPNCRDFGKLPDFIPLDHILRDPNVMCVHPYHKRHNTGIAGIHEALRIRFLSALSSGLAKIESMPTADTDQYSHILDFARLFLQCASDEISETQYKQERTKLLERTAPTCCKKLPNPMPPLTWMELSAFDDAEEVVREAVDWNQFEADAHLMYLGAEIFHQGLPSSSFNGPVIMGIQSASRTVLALPFPCGIKMGVSHLKSRHSSISWREFDGKWDMSEEILSSQEIDSWIGALDRLVEPNLLPLVMREPFARAQINEEKKVVGGFIIRDISLLQKNIWVPGFSIPLIFPQEINPDLINAQYHKSLGMLQARLLDRYGIWHVNLHRQNVRVRLCDEGRLTDHAIAIDLSDFGIIEPIARHIAKKYQIELPSDQIFPSIHPHPNYGRERLEIVELHLNAFATQLENLWDCPEKITPIFDPKNCQEHPDDRRKIADSYEQWRLDPKLLTGALPYEVIAWTRFRDWLISEEARAILEIRYAKRT